MQGCCHCERCFQRDEAEGKEVVEPYCDFRKAYDKANHAFLEQHLKVCCFPAGNQMLIVEMMARWKNRLSHGRRRRLKIRLTNGIIQGDVFSPLLFVPTIDPLIKIAKKRLGDRVEVLYSMDDKKASVSGVGMAQTVHEIVKKCGASVGMVLNTKKGSIQLNVETPLPQSLQDILDWMRRPTSTLDSK